MGSRSRAQVVLFPESSRAHGWGWPGSTEGFEWQQVPGQFVRVVVVELRAPGPQVPKPPRCSPGAANRSWALGSWSRFARDCHWMQIRVYSKFKNRLLPLTAVDNFKKCWVGTCSDSIWP
jgi:hypothetical protein